jgi:hypothetical protein
MNGDAMNGDAMRTDAEDGARGQPPAPPVPPIGLNELMRRLADPRVPEEELKPYLTARVDQRVGLAPVLLPNENVETKDEGAVQARARGDIGLGFLNAVYQARRRHHFEKRLADRDQRPFLMAEGDSWFQYPVFLDDVVDHLDPHYNVFCVSAAGAELRTMVADAEYIDHLRRLGQQGVKFAAFLFSGAGNDVVGDQMTAFLQAPGAGAGAQDCIKTDAFRAKMDQILGQYATMISAVRKVLPKVPILIHGYDYAVPLPPQGFRVPPRDGWLGAPMRKVGIHDLALQAGIVHAMMDLVNAGLESLAGGNRAGQHPDVFFVDNRHVVGERWFDELHPDEDGFRDVTANFVNVMREQARIP